MSTKHQCARVAAKAKATYANRRNARSSGGKSTAQRRPAASTEARRPAAEQKPTEGRHRYSKSEWDAFRSKQADRVQESTRILTEHPPLQDDGWATMGSRGKVRSTTAHEIGDINDAKKSVEHRQDTPELQMTAPNKRGWAGVAVGPTFNPPSRTSGDVPVIVLGGPRITGGAWPRKESVSKKSGFSALTEEIDTFTQFPGLQRRVQPAKVDPGLSRSKSAKSSKSHKTVRFNIVKPEAGLDDIDQALADIMAEKRARITKKVAAARAKDASSRAKDASSPPHPTETEETKLGLGAWGKKSKWVKSGVAKTTSQPVIVIPVCVVEPEVFVFSDAHILSNEANNSGDEFWEGSVIQYPPEIQGDWGAMDEWDRAHA